MKVSLSLPIFALNVFCVSTSRKYLNEGQLEANPSAAMEKKWPEQHFATDTEEVPLKADDGEESESKQEDREEAEAKDLFAHDYYRDSAETDMEPLTMEAPVKFEDNLGNGLDSHEKKHFKSEIAAGDVTELFGTNAHYYQPEGYRDLGRRFVLQYPYKEIDQNKLVEDAEDSSLIPKLAPPELVLAVAKESAMLEAAKPMNPTDQLIQKDILRTGEYWNAFWKEDVNPNLRTSKRNKMDSVRAKLSPGTDLYDYVSNLQKLYPKLLYVINKKN